MIPQQRIDQDFHSTSNQEHPPISFYSIHDILPQIHSLSSDEMNPSLQNRTAIFINPALTIKSKNLYYLKEASNTFKRLIDTGAAITILKKTQSKILLSSNPCKRINFNSFHNRWPTQSNYLQVWCWIW